MLVWRLTWVSIRISLVGVLFSEVPLGSVAVSQRFCKTEETRAVVTVSHDSTSQTQRSNHSLWMHRVWTLPNYPWLKIWNVSVWVTLIKAELSVSANVKQLNSELQSAPWRSVPSISFTKSHPSHTNSRENFITCSIFSKFCFNQNMVYAFQLGAWTNPILGKLISFSRTGPLHLAFFLIYIMDIFLIWWYIYLCPLHILYSLPREQL